MSSIKFFIILGILFITNCSENKVSNYHGAKLLEDKYTKLKVNETNKNDIINLIGPPSTISDFNRNKWFYFERLKTNQSLIMLGTQKIKKNNVLIIDLNNKGILEAKHLLNLDNMNDVKYLKFVTTKEFKNENFLYGVFSSLREKINAPLRNR